MKTKFQKLLFIFFGATLGALISINFQALAEKTTSPNLPIEDLRTFAEVFGKIKTDYVEDIEDKKLINEALTGMLAGLDPHSTFLDLDNFKEMQQGTSGEFGGLGIEVGMEDGFVKVISPIEDTPAYEAGLKSGDLIMKLDQTQVKGLTLNEAVKLMRGKPGSSIKIQVLRKGIDAPFDVTIVRAHIQTKSVKAKIVEPNYGYVRITQFQERTTQDLAEALKKIRRENKYAFNGIVLDLRNNPGGLLNAAVGVSAAFLEEGDLVVYTEGRAPDSKMHLAAIPENYVRNYPASKNYFDKVPSDVKHTPLVVLVNNGSASASEIVAGALQDHGRGTILGTRSFGKGSVQSILPMNNGTAIKLTTALYFTPNGRSIQSKGIEPDVVVDDGFEQFAMREEDVTNHIVNPQGEDAPAKTDKPADAPTTGSEALKNFKPIELGGEDDKQFQQALLFLKGIDKGIDYSKPKK